MKIITYSDLHLEFKHGWALPADVDADLLILAGDIISFANYKPLAHLLKGWSKPVLYVAGNHEYYTQNPMDRENGDFRAWLSENLPYVVCLQDEGITIDGVHFFGGTMWTNFANENPVAMVDARRNMNDFRLIRTPEGEVFTPEYSVKLHRVFVEKLMAWFQEGRGGPHVVISHHAPVINPNTQYRNSPLQPAFNSLDMVEIIEEYRPNLWVYGHTHECDDQTFGDTRIISNQLGYATRSGGYECRNFDENGKAVVVSAQKSF